VTLRHAIWTVGAKPELLAPGALPSEQLLEEMIVAAPQVLSDEWMLIGRQEPTGHGGRVDLLAIAPDGALVLIELKRDRTPRDVVAQALDYASWVDALEADEIAAIYARFAPGRSLADDFRRRFGVPLDEASLNQNHQIVIVASSLDPGSQRIVAYLSARDIPINVLCFQVFAQGAQQLLSRAWLLDPEQAPAPLPAPKDGAKEPWNGEFYASFGAGPERSWEEAVALGFISAGGGTWYTKTLKLLGAGDRVWVKSPDHGFVGVCRVAGPAEPARTFRVRTPQGDETPVLDAVRDGHYFRDAADDPDRCEHFVPVRWLQTVPLAEAVKEIGLFGNQNTVCKPVAPKWRSTVETLKRRFPDFGSEPCRELAATPRSQRSNRAARRRKGDGPRQVGPPGQAAMTSRPTGATRHKGLPRGSRTAGGA
jgi:hypothetical protein